MAKSVGIMPAYMVNIGGPTAGRPAIIPVGCRRGQRALSGRQARRCGDLEVTMPATLSAIARVPWPLMLLAIGVALALAATLVLWGYYGTAVFFELVRAGWALCF